MFKSPRLFLLGAIALLLAGCGSGTVAHAPAASSIVLTPKSSAVSTPVEAPRAKAPAPPAPPPSGDAPTALSGPHPQNPQPSANTALPPKIVSGLNQHTIVRATANTIYPKGKGVLLGDELGVALINYGVEMDQYPFREYIVADVSIYNLRNSEYYPTPGQFILRRETGETYSASFGAHTNGTVFMGIPPRSTAQGGVAFLVPLYGSNGNIVNPSFDLEFQGGIQGAPSVVSFAINASGAPCVGVSMCVLPLAP